MNSYKLIIFIIFLNLLMGIAINEYNENNNHNDLIDTTINKYNTDDYDLNDATSEGTAEEKETLTESTILDDYASSTKLFNVFREGINPFSNLGITNNNIITEYFMQIISLFRLLMNILLLITTYQLIVNKKTD